MNPSDNLSAYEREGRQTHDCGGPLGSNPHPHTDPKHHYPWRDGWLLARVRELETQRDALLAACMAVARCSFPPCRNCKVRINRAIAKCKKEEPTHDV